MRKHITAFLQDESGQTSTEYIMLVAVVAFIILRFKSVIEQRLVGNGGLVEKVFQKADGILDGLQ
jgi:pilus assembly protein Flp/PilA